MYLDDIWYVPTKLDLEAAKRWYDIIIEAHPELQIAFTSIQQTMPRFDFAPTSVSTAISILPKGQHEVVLGEPKSFYRQGKSGKADNYGIMFRATVAEGEAKGKTVFLNAFLHTPDAFGFAKALQMAAFGYNPRNEDDENRFNTEHGNDDWSYDTDTGSCGDGWQSMKGQHLILDADVTMNEQTQQQQNRFNYLPVPR